MTDEIGWLHPQRGLGLYRAECAACEWHWTGDRKQAESHLHSHVALSHPRPIPVYARGDGGTP